MTFKKLPLKNHCYIYIFFLKINKNENPLAYDELLLHNKRFRKVATLLTHVDSDT